MADNATIVAFGDSLTFGTGASPDKSYPARLSSLIGREIVNHSVPGEISRDGLSRLPGVLDEIKPALLILCHGGNDFLRKLDTRETEANIRAMVKIARDRNIGVLLLATPKPGLMLSSPEFYDKIGSELSVPVEGAVLAKVLGDNGLKADLVHPNANGYSRIAEAIAATLERNGAL
ncbi:MAG: GDSL-type esterase/lipase family protein [Burkholderiales bacterium]